MRDMIVAILAGFILSLAVVVLIDNFLPFTWYYVIMNFAIIAGITFTVSYINFKTRELLERDDHV